MRTIEEYRENRKLSKTIRKIICIIIIVAAVTAFFSFLQYYLQVRITPISWKSKAHLILEDGTEYAETIPVELEGAFYHYNVGGGHKVDSIEILATAHEHETEIFRGTAVYYSKEWQWVIHNREKTGYGHVDWQAMFTNYSKRNDNALFLFCIDDVSKITDGDVPGKAGLLAVTKRETDKVSRMIQSFLEECDPEVLDFLEEYGLWKNGF